MWSLGKSENYSEGGVSKQLNLYIGRISIEHTAPPSLCGMNVSWGKIELGGNFVSS